MGGIYESGQAREEREGQPQRVFLLLQLGGYNPLRLGGYNQISADSRGAGEIR